ncbi:hypothetical protein RDABS01_027368 [Bienertia sinuspersici]
MADWSQLPQELIEQIALKLDTLEDFVVFATICRPWNNALTSLKEHERFPKLMPWLLLSFNPNRNIHYNLDLFDPCKDKCYRFNLPEAYNRRCWGTSLGWILTLGLDLEIHLLNPITKASIRLPPQPLLTPVLTDPDDSDLWKIQLYYIKRVFVFKSPIDGQLIVFVVHYDDNVLSFVKPGDSSWIPIELQVPSSEYLRGDNSSNWNQIIQLHNVMDITYWNGAFVIVSKFGGFTFLDLNQIAQQQQPCLVQDYPLIPLEISNIENNNEARIYLVECNSDLLMVLRFKAEFVDSQEDDDDYSDLIPVDYETINFKVYRHSPGFDMDRGWEELHDLGDLAIFVGSHSTMCVTASSVANCRGNNIYFTDDDYHVCTRRDMGVFDMKTGTIEPYYLNVDDNEFRQCHPVWFLPRI